MAGGRFRAVCTALFASGAVVSAARAQVITVLTGRTLDFVTDGPIATVEVALLGRDRRPIASVVTDSAGRFRFERIAPGDWRLRASSIGYQTVLTPDFELPSGDTVDVVIRLAVDAVPLAPLEVIARATPIHRNPGLAGFYRRVERSIGGRFVLRDEIETRNQRRVTDLLITTGVSVIGVPEGGYRGLFMKRSNCAPMVYLDGAPLMRTGDAMSRPTAAYEAANVLTPFDVEGIEVYPGPASVPSEFGGPTAGCGVIAIWSRRGG
jgi:hypothetical protein